jgi:hypothetical protein
LVRARRHLELHREGRATVAALYVRIIRMNHCGSSM